MKLNGQQQAHSDSKQTFCVMHLASTNQDLVTIENPALRNEIILCYVGNECTTGINNQHPYQCYTILMYLELNIFIKKSLLKAKLTR